jgi:protease IV
MQYATLELNGKYHEIDPRVGGLAGVPFKKQFRLDLFYKKVERLGQSRSIQRVLVHRRKGFSVPAFGGLEEIRAALRRLSGTGKQVYYYASEYDVFDSVLASACSQRILHPLGTVSFLGIAQQDLFFKRLLDTHAIGVEVIRRGRYKSAADRFRTEKHDEYARGQYQALVDGAVAAMREAVLGAPAAVGREAWPETLLDEMLAGRILTASEARESGVVDALHTINDLTNAWKAEKIKEKTVRVRRPRLVFGARVAVLVFEGMIVEGDSHHHPLFGQAIGDRPMIKAIRALREHRRVKAVVFRINSGGGSAVASENILRELMALQEKKPLVISMGPLAASGGYWIAGTGGRLFALPTTITGSIGVVTLFFNFSELLRTHGITTDCIKCGDAADLGSALRSPTDQEKATIDGVVQSLYEAFIERVAQVRKMAPEKVRALGEGRVWLGSEAVRHGLVDVLGGLHDAIMHARTLIKSESARVTFGPRWKRPLISRLLEGYGAKALTDAGNAGTIPLAVIRACLALHGRPSFLEAGLCRPKSASKAMDALQATTKYRVQGVGSLSSLTCAEKEPKNADWC